MHRAMTAVYRTHAAADMVRGRLIDLGVSRSDISLIPDDPTPIAEDGFRDADSYARDVHDLHLPDDDARSYAESVRRGDFVVSVELDGDADEGAIAEAMRHPDDMRDLAGLDRDYAGAEYARYDYASDPEYRTDPYRGTDPGAAGMGAAATGTTTGAEYDPERYRGTREEGEDSYVRAYTRPNRITRGGRETM